MNKAASLLVAFAAAAVCLVAVSQSGCWSGPGAAGSVQTRAAGGPPAVPAQNATSASRRQSPGVAPQNRNTAVRSLSSDQLTQALIRRAPATQVAPRSDVAPKPGLYGEIAAKPHAGSSPYLKPRADADAWQSKPFAVVVSELSPAVLYRSELARSRSSTASPNGDMAVPRGGHPSGIVVAGRGDRVDGRLQAEPWMLVWFAGGDGWQFDVPWLIVLEHRPASSASGPTGSPSGSVAGGLARRDAVLRLLQGPPGGRKWSDRLDGAGTSASTPRAGRPPSPSRWTARAGGRRCCGGTRSDATRPFAWTG